MGERCAEEQGLQVDLTPVTDRLAVLPGTGERGHHEGTSFREADLRELQVDPSQGSPACHVY